MGVLGRGVVRGSFAGKVIVGDGGGCGKAVACFAGGGVTEAPYGVGTEGEGAEFHERRLLVGQRAIGEGDFGEALRVCGVDLGDSNAIGAD